MSASTSRKSFDTRRFARSTNSGIGLDGSVRRKKSATASSARMASCRDLTAPTARSPPGRAAAVRLRGAAPLPSGARQLRRGSRLIFASCGKGARSRAPPRARLRPHARVDALQRRHRRVTPCCTAVSSSSGTDANAALICRSSGRPRLGRRRLSAGDLDVAEAEPAVLAAADERQPPQAVDDRHRIGEAVQRVAPDDRVLVDDRIDLGPVRREPAARRT